MKTTLLIAVLLLGSVIAQNGYTPGGAGSITLPSGLSSGSGSDSGFGGNGGSGAGVVVPSFPKADITKISVIGSTNSQVTTSNIISTINNAKQELSTPVRSIESLFTRFPSKSELDKFADDGDTGAILKTLNVVASDDSVPCGTKISYLLELLGSVKNAIQRKNLLADQLASIIDGAKAEIARLQGEIDRIQKDRDALGIPSLETKVNDLISRLQVLYNQINAVKAQIPPEDARVQGFLKEISTLEKQNDDERNRISNDKLKLAQTINLIKDLESRLQDARDTKAALEASISASDAIIRDNNAKISNIRTTIAEINAKIKSLQDTADRLKRDANLLEVDLERARTNLSVAKVKDNRYSDDIRALKDRIAQEQPKLVDDDLSKLRTIVENLNRIIPNIQSEIDREYYYCYGAGKVQIETTGSTLVYIIKGEAFGQYIDNAYGQRVAAPGLRTGADYRLKVVDPFSAIWTSKFGYPNAVGGATRGGAGAGAGAAGFKSFSCLPTGSTSSGSGVINKISGTGIEIKDAKGNNVSLNIGACSRMESTTSVPQVGQNLVWRGAPSSNGGFDLFGATCY